MFKTYFIDVLIHHYADFKGRATRKQFWMWFLCCFIITFAVSFVLNFIAGFCEGMQLPSAPQIKETLNSINIMFTNIWVIAILLPNVSISARRIKDAGLPVLLVLLMIPSYIVLIMNMFAQKPPLELSGFSCLAGIVVFILWLLPSKKTE
ncbi:MAG: DUF805 domain-containing protein [Elusimicrobiaceae bacterium]|nr:DUF805 domain-containing protein [Elusimicrobiaceae bacterium]